MASQPLSPGSPALNAFALRLLAALPPSGTQAVSPFSVACALAMAGLGARGQTDVELRGVLGIGGAPGDLEQLAKQLQAVPSLAAPDIVQIASALWPDHTVPIEEAYLAAASALFHAELSPLNLADKVASAARVNRWVSERTNGRIDAILVPEAVPEPPGLLLSNAFYFNGRWVDPFAVGATARAAFHAPGGDVDVPLMTQTLTTWYGETSSMQCIDLSYTGGCGLLVVLPKARSSLRHVMGELAKPNALDHLVSGLNFQEVRLWLPKVTLDSGVMSLVTPLRHLGATLLFSPAADLSGLTSFLPAWFEEVAHRATIEVDEHGTVAAAATVLMARCVASLEEPPPPIEMRVDRPYLMLIRLRRTGAILFASTVTTPPVR